MGEKDVSVDVVAMKILLIRGKKVMLDRDLAELYGVETKYLTRQVRRNLKRFPEDFMIRLSRKEYIAVLRCQNVTLKRGQQSKYLPYAFTQEGVDMLSGILNSDRAVQVNIAIMRAFVKLRQVLLTHKDLAEKLEELERKYQFHESGIQMIFEAIKKLLEPPQEPPKPRFNVN